MTTWNTEDSKPDRTINRYHNRYSSGQKYKRAPKPYETFSLYNDCFGINNTEGCMQDDAIDRYNGEFVINDTRDWNKDETINHYNGDFVINNS